MICEEEEDAAVVLITHLPPFLHACAPLLDTNLTRPFLLTQERQNIGPSSHRGSSLIHRRTDAYPVVPAGRPAPC
jgi:hypothetical protein